ncbi:MAG TPA: MFS transporter [Xanthobacteraceae bacterium]|jgi:EmrB/QacA subfamily drug resistance transporter|nr:MFS transporter [Xanthobacteraceae bacterium]
MPPESKPKIIAMIVGSAIIMQQIDSTVITTALPQMAISLHTDPVKLSVAVTAYLLSLAVFVPVSGWAADRFGGRTVFRAAIALFTVGSILCGLSGNVVELTAARVLQGFGGAMMVPVGRLVLFRSIDKAALIGTMAYLQVPAQLGPVLGPPIGGFITTYFSWRWIFLINVPLGILGIVLVTLFFDNPKEGDTRPFDMPGFVLTGAALFCMMYAIEAAGRGRGDLGELGVLVSFGIVSGVLGIWHLHRAKYPVLDLSVFRITTFQTGISGGSLFRAGAGSLVFLLPLLLQVVFGMTAFASGTITFATAVGSISMKMAAKPVLRRFGFRKVIVVNSVISAATVAMCGFFTVSTPVLLIFVLLLIAGFFQSLQYTATQAMSYADIEQPQMATATSILSMSQQLSRGFGIALSAAVLHWSLAARGATALGTVDFMVAFVSLAFVALAGLPFGWILRHDAAAAVSGHRANVRDRIA